MTDRPHELQAILIGGQASLDGQRAACAWTLGAALLPRSLCWPASALSRWWPAKASPSRRQRLWCRLPLSRSGSGRSGRSPPTDRQIARFIEERDRDLDDVVVTAVDYGARPDASARMRDALWPATPRAPSAPISTSTSIPLLTRFQCAGGVQPLRRPPLGCCGVGFRAVRRRAINVASAYLFPARLTVEVMPGPPRCARASR